MKKNEIMTKITRTINKVGFKLKKRSPEILVIAGVVGVVTSTVMACKATTKLSDILEESKDQLDQVHEYIEEHGFTEKYTEKDSKKDTTIVYAQTGVKIAKLYGPAVAVGTISIAAILGGHNILRKRNLALAAAYTAVDKSFKEYRGRVVERFGKELDKELKYNIKSKEIEKIVKDEETGEEKVIKENAIVADPNDISEFAKFYDDGCIGWTKDSEANLMFLRKQQAWANAKLKEMGYLFLNDVYEMLGIPKSKAGQMVGWIYDEECPNGDNYVDFGIYDVNKPANMDFVNGYERTILLDFNVDGNILDLM